METERIKYCLDWLERFTLINGFLESTVSAALKDAKLELEKIEEYIAKIQNSNME